MLPGFWMLGELEPALPICSHSAPAEGNHPQFKLKIFLVSESWLSGGKQTNHRGNESRNVGGWSTFRISARSVYDASLTASGTATALLVGTFWVPYEWRQFKFLQNPQIVDFRKFPGRRL
jgi:hypothetical protein